MLPRVSYVRYMAKRVMIADDSEFMRNLLREILEDDFEIVGEAENGV